ncbi:MAG: TonB-dependent receptor domain-containing protein [Bryobacteraceae bacterium]
MRLLPLLLCTLSALAQDAGGLQGTVSLAVNGDALHRATVRITQLGLAAETDAEGRYAIANVPPGVYTVAASMHDLTAETRRVEIRAGQTAAVDFQLRLAPIKQQVTVTASGHEQTALERFQSVASIQALELAERAETSLGEVLDHQPGVAKRSFGPGSSRPVIRGFDGDRVLIMQDGMPTGTISSQSGDHGDGIDAASLDAVEVVKGPATLLYGSTALGGVVNAITGHHQVHDHPHAGLRGNFTAIGGSNNGHGGGAGGLEYGFGDWLVWGDASAQRTGDYRTPLGAVENSKTRVSNTSTGAGWYGGERFLTGLYGYDEGRYGVPFAAQLGGEGDEPVDLAFSRHHARLYGGLGSTRLSLAYTKWRHREIAGGETGTIFNNRQVLWRGTWDQRKTGRFAGTFGASGLFRRYRAEGEEALSPPVDHNSQAVFGMEEIAFERIRFQLGGRVERNAYSPDGLRARAFTGFSGSGAINLPVWRGGAFIANLTRAYRAPALEELYNHGPHVGNLTFEIGNPDLKSEQSTGFEFSLRHQASRVRAEASVFRYAIGRFVFLAPTGRVRSGLREADYMQSDARFMGGEADLSVALAPDIALNLGMDYVNAELKDGPPLPRIPPLRGRVGVEARRNAWSFKPELALAGVQERLFPGETRTAGYAVVNLYGSYTRAGQHAVQLFALQVFNATDRLYRNHLSFIKELAPEIGRGVRFTYTIRFF